VIKFSQGKVIRMNLIGPIGPLIKTLRKRILRLVIKWESKIVERLEEPVWVNEDGVGCEEGEVFGCKVMNCITCTDLALCVDEVGGDTSQKSNGAVRGEKLVCPTGTTPKEKVLMKEKHWTLLGFTAFDSSHLICIIIFAGKQKVPLYETRIDPFSSIKSNPAKAEFFNKNYGPGKLYPGEDEVHIQGKRDALYVPLAPKGSIDSTIPTNILRTLDNIDCHEEARRNDFKLMLLLDVYGSKMELEFLSYINSAGSK